MATVTYTIEELIAHKESGKVVPELIEKLRADADAILEKPTLKVVDIKLPRPSGDLHDYVSIGPYWWPNPDTPDGLPWVNRDGIVNPDTQNGIGPGGIYSRIQKLAWACFYIGDNGYSEYANRQLYDWFLNPETRTNPNAKYSQGLPGICEGRSTGLISFGTAYVLFNAIGILEHLGLIKEDILAGVKEWYVEFTDWVLTHEYGLGADNSASNHGSWHDANVLATAVFTERAALVKKICKTAYFNRLVRQITLKGEQPEELRRTKGMSYSFFNLQALIVVANIAERLGYSEFWATDEIRGHCILKNAIDFMYPYVKNPETFPYGELYPNKQSAAMTRCLLAVAKRYPGEGYEAKAAEFDNPTFDFHLEPVF